MRYILVRIWAVLTIGLLAGVLGDVGTEFSATFGWLGAATRDVDHQGVLPAFAITLILALGLAAYVVGSRIAPNDALIRRLDDCARTRGRRDRRIRGKLRHRRCGRRLRNALRRLGAVRCKLHHHRTCSDSRPIICDDRRCGTDDARRGDPLCRAQRSLGCSTPHIVPANLALAPSNGEARDAASSGDELFSRCS